MVRARPMDGREKKELKEQQPGVVVDRLAGDLHHPVVHTVRQQGVGQRTEKELNIKL